MLRKHRLEIVLVAAIALTTAFYVRASYIPSFSDRHVDVAEQKYDYDVGEPGSWFSAWSLGDGQAFVMIALDPSGNKLDEEIDEAGYRFARAGYGWATYAAALGQNEAIPYALAIVGTASLVALIVMAVRLRPRLGRRAWFVLANPAIYIGFGGDTSEPLAVLLLTMAMASSGWVAAVLLGVTRPTFLIGLWGQWRKFIAGLASAVLLGTYSLLTFGSDALIPSGGRIGWPLTSYFEHSSFWGWVLATCAVATLILGIRRREWAWILGGLFALSFGADVLRDPVNTWRAAGFLPVLWAFGAGYDASESETVSKDVAAAGI